MIIFFHFWSTAFFNWKSVGLLIPLYHTTDLVSLPHLPKCSSSSSHTFLIARYWSLKSCMLWNLTLCRLIRLICAMALSFPMYMSFSISFNRPIESIFFSSSGNLHMLSTWLSVTESLSDLLLFFLFSSARPSYIAILSSCGQFGFISI